MMRTYCVNIKNRENGELQSYYLASENLKQALEKAHKAASFYQVESQDYSWVVESVALMPLPLY